MMDSQENTLGQEKTEELLNVAPADNSDGNGGNTDVANKMQEETTVGTEEAPTAQTEADAPEQKKVYKSKKEVIARLKEIAHSDENPKKDEMEILKTAFTLKAEATQTHTRCNPMQTKRNSRPR